MILLKRDHPELFVDLVYISQHTSRFLYGHKYSVLSIKQNSIYSDKDVRIVHILDKDGVVMDFYLDTLHNHFISLVEFRNLKLESIGI